jgi:phosphohistidine phosphatase SixA
MSSIMMKIILIRHASRVRESSSDKDEELPLSPDGEKEARELGDKMASLGLRPTLYLTSRYAHAKQTAEFLRDQVTGDPPASVVAISTLTPHEPYDFEGIIRESEQTGHDLSRLELVAFVLHHPRLNQLLGRLTSQPVSPGAPKYSEAVCLTADSLGDFLEGKGKVDFRIEVR